MADQVQRFQELGWQIPLSLRTWWEVVGSVNLMGTHPDWPHAGYGFDTADVWDADPLVVELSDLVDQYEDGRFNRDELGPDYLKYIHPFRIPIAPDAINKAGYSGGDPYQVSCDAPQVDAIVLNEPQCVSFVASLRIAFEWGGFPGLRSYPDAPLDLINELKKDLVPF